MGLVLGLVTLIGAWGSSRAPVPMARARAAAAPNPNPNPDPKPGPELAELIDAALAEPFLADARIGISVVDLETGASLYQRGEGVPLNPASNVKLVTTMADRPKPL